MGQLSAESSPAAGGGIEGNGRKESDSTQALRGVATALRTASRIVEQDEAGIKAAVCVKLLLRRLKYMRNVLNRTVTTIG
jgi:hypothetical protein